MVGVYPAIPDAAPGCGATSFSQNRHVSTCAADREVLRRHLGELARVSGSVPRLGAQDRLAPIRGTGGLDRTRAQRRLGVALRRHVRELQQRGPGALVAALTAGKNHEPYVPTMRELAEPRQAVEEAHLSEAERADTDTAAAPHENAPGSLARAQHKRWSRRPTSS